MESNAGFVKMRCPLNRTRAAKVRHSRDRVVLRGMQDPSQVVGDEVKIDALTQGLLSRVIGRDALGNAGIAPPAQEDVDLDSTE